MRWSFGGGGVGVVGEGVTSIVQFLVAGDEGGGDEREARVVVVFQGVVVDDVAVGDAHAVGGGGDLGGAVVDLDENEGFGLRGPLGWWGASGTCGEIGRRRGGQARGW